MTPSSKGDDIKGPWTSNKTVSFVDSKDVLFCCIPVLDFYFNNCSQRSLSSYPLVSFRFLSNPLEIEASNPTTITHGNCCEDIDPGFFLGRKIMFLGSVSDLLPSISLSLNPAA